MGKGHIRERSLLTPWHRIPMVVYKCTSEMEKVHKCEEKISFCRFDKSFTCNNLLHLSAILCWVGSGKQWDESVCPVFSMKWQSGTINWKLCRAAEEVLMLSWNGGTTDFFAIEGVILITINILKMFNTALVKTQLNWKLYLFHSFRTCTLDLIFT